MTELIRAVLDAPLANLACLVVIGYALGYGVKRLVLSSVRGKKRGNHENR